jgi:amino acid adenylation domain-containing protein
VAIDLATRTPETRECVGLFVNELPLASRPSSTATFRELLDATRADLRELYPYREVPLARAVPGIRPRLALAGVSMSYRRRSAAPRFAGLETSIDWMVFNGAARSALHLQVVDGPDALAASLQYSPDAIDAGGAARIAGHLLALLRGAVADPASRVAALPLLPREERERLIGEWNVTATGPRGPATVPRLFEAQVARSPGATAVVAGDARMTYAELHAAANRLAHRLRGAGVRPGTLVAVGVERSLELVVALLAVLEAGGAYLPLDPGHPAARLALVLADAGAPLVLTQRRLADRFAGSAAEVLALDDGGRLDGVPATDPAPPAGPGDLAYVIYTSGSTGRPKGVEIEHRSLANVVGAFRDALGAGSRDVWLAATSPSFDISALELFLPIVSGGRLVVAGESDVRDGAALVRLVREHAVTHVQATPSGWRLLLEAGFDERGVVALCGGEPLPVPLARDLRGRVARILNVYGPTETTVWSTLAEVAPDAGEVTIGRPIASTRVYLLDGRLELVPSGLPGELCIGGAGLARGYRRRPGLTAERFVPDPHGPPGARLYRTGDRARHRPDGRLEFLGRTDHQVKIRGHRVELGEIEAVLLGHPRVGQAAVALRPDPAGGQRLVAYLVLAGGGPATAEIRQHLGRALPEAMVPASFVTLEALPLTPNGKLDRAALPEPPAREAAAAPAASVVGLAKDVGDICREVMRIDDIQPDESLFDLGGHSLTMTMIASRIRKRLRKELPLHVFYDAPTIAGIVEALTQVESGR